MKMKSKLKLWCLTGAVMLSASMPVSAESSSAVIKTDIEVAAELGLIQGEGSGVTEAYLAKTTTRMQAAILYLRLKGLEKDALAFKAGDNFKDAHLVSEQNQSVLSYLKVHPELGWSGTGNNAFEPTALITAEQYYKVLLEASGYKQDTDFTYSSVITYAKELGLSRIAGEGSLRNRHIAIATVEGLKLKTKGGDKRLADVLAELKVIDQTHVKTAKASGIKLATNKEYGAYLADEQGKTLYMFTKDAPNVSNCKDACEQKWPIYYADQLQIPSELNAADFATIIRGDGKPQITYKGMPLYYFISDEKAGDVKGQGVGNAWYVVNHYSVTTSEKEGLGKFLVDGKGNTLYMFTKDQPGVSVCKGACEALWPIYYSSDIYVSADLNAADFTTIVREDGTKQTAYKGMPLYYFVKDAKPGDTTGQDVNKVWYVINVTGTAK